MVCLDKVEFFYIFEVPLNKALNKAIRYSFPPGSLWCFCRNHKRQDGHFFRQISESEFLVQKVLDG